MTNPSLRPEITPEWFKNGQLGTLPEHFGLVVTRIAPGILEASFELQPWMRAPNGYLHAATQIALADTSAGYACVAHLPEGARGFTTIELKSNFLRSIQEGRLTCIATAEHLGKTTQVWGAVVRGPDGETLSLFRCTQLVLR
jgi:1,4-dihydroxy-2-naphthoyl-CoA hydrolase